MLTKGIWDNYKDELKKRTLYKTGYEYTSEEMAWKLLGIIVLTPFVVAIDILGSPIELAFLVCNHFVTKEREKLDWWR